MAQIGQFTAENSGFVGRVHTLTIYRELTIVPAEQSDAESAPDYRIHHGAEDGPEIGAGWKRTGERAGGYVSLLIDDPALAQPIRANLFQNGAEARRAGLRAVRYPVRPALLFLSGLVFVLAPTVATLAQNVPIERPASSDPYAAHIAEASQRFGIPATGIKAVMRVESANDAQAISSAGAMGLMQIMPDTWAELRVRHRLGRDPYDPHDNILAGAAYLREMYDRYGNVAAMLAAYNAGPARYGEYLATGRALPAETRAYVAAIAPVIGRAAPASTPGTPPDWRDAPLFTVQTDGNGNADSDVVERPTDGPSAAEIAPQSDGLFVAWTGAEPSP